jgi:large subunit ribosomal protein L24e
MKCSFCKNQIPKGTGKLYIKKDGKIFYFCSSKCEKNQLKLKRKSRTTRWTQEAQKLKKEGVTTKRTRRKKSKK